MNADRLNEIRAEYGEDFKRLTAILAATEKRAACFQARAVQAEQERDEWQELAVRLAEEAGVDAEQMLAQARDEA